MYLAGARLSSVVSFVKSGFTFAIVAVLEGRYREHASAGCTSTGEYAAFHVRGTGA
jgi:hypothetical protein